MQGMETDEDRANVRESFLLVQNILLMEYTDVFPVHVKETMVEKTVGNRCNLVWFFDSLMWREVVVSFYPTPCPHKLKLGFNIMIKPRFKIST